MANHSETQDRMHGDVPYAKAIATVLHEEFGVPFTVYDATARTWLWPQTNPDGQPRLAPDDWEELREISQAGRIRLTLLPRGGYRLRLPVGPSGGPVLIAEAVLKALANAGPDTALEQQRLQAWGQAVLERLRQADQLRSRRRIEDDLKSQLKNVWGLYLTLERLIRHVRVHKIDAASQQQVLEAALPFLDAEALIWVPKTLGPVPHHGKPVLAAEDARSLANTLRKEPDLRESGLLLCNQVRGTSWGVCFPSVENLMAMATPTGTPVGWLLALNKRRPDGWHESAGPTAEVGFRRADAATLSPFAALLGLQVRSRERHQDLKDLLVGLMRSLASAVDAKDPYTYGHSERVARIAVELGRELGLTEDQLSDLYLAGLLHDIGKIGIREEVLCKRTALTAEETEYMRRHPTIGHAILKDLQQISSLLPGVLHHHERYDGKGYPAGLAGEQIPLSARILAVADGFDAMSTTRPYRKALSPARVEQILAEGAGEQWDGRVIEAFQRCQDRLRAIHERGLGESLRQALDGVLRDNGSSLAWPLSMGAQPVAT